MISTGSTAVAKPMSFALTDCGLLHYCAGYNDVLDDAKMGWARYAHSMRVFVFNSGLFYIQPTLASLDLLDRIAYRLDHENGWDQAIFNEVNLSETVLNMLICACLTTVHKQAAVSFACQSDVCLPWDAWTVGSMPPEQTFCAAPVDTMQQARVYVTVKTCHSCEEVFAMTSCDFCITGHLLSLSWPAQRSLGHQASHGLYGFHEQQDPVYYCTQRPTATETPACHYSRQLSPRQASSNACCGSSVCRWRYAGFSFLS